jgi:hypothetical protein
MQLVAFFFISARHSLTSRKLPQSVAKVWNDVLAGTFTINELGSLVSSVSIVTMLQAGNQGSGV